MTPRRPLSGTQVFLNHGRYSAVVTSVGASLRRLQYDGRDLVVPFDADQVRPAYRGAILAPWPNRVVDGRYTFEGIPHQLSITEPRRGHALHGLLAWQDWTVVSSTSCAVTLLCRLVAQQGYPFPLLVEVTYALADAGLTTTITAGNPGPTTAPYGVAAHPYLVAGDGPLDDWILELPARAVLQVTEDRLIPTSVGAVDTPGLDQLDFREPRRLGSVRIDHAFTALIRRGQDQATVRLTRTDGTGTGMAWGTELAWVQIHTADLPVEGSRRGLAVEPMTCPPDAYNSGTDLTALPPGESHTACWRIYAIR